MKKPAGESKLVLLGPCAGMKRATSGILSINQHCEFTPKNQLDSFLLCADRHPSPTEPEHSDLR